MNEGDVRWNPTHGVIAIFTNGEWVSIESQEDAVRIAEETDRVAVLNGTGGVVGFWEGGQHHGYLGTEEDRYLYRIGYESENR